MVFTGACPIRERTADCVSVGRCWHATHEYECPRHGHVGPALRRFAATGELTDECYPVIALVRLAGHEGCG